MLSAVRRQACDVILMDIQMPEMDGFFAKPLDVEQLHDELLRCSAVEPGQLDKTA